MSRSTSGMSENGSATDGPLSTMLMSKRSPGLPEVVVAAAAAFFLAASSAAATAVATAAAALAARLEG